MVYGRGIGRTAIEIAKASGAFVSGRDFIMRNAPPGYREPALKLFRAFEQAATGAGLYQIVSEFNNAIFQAQNGKQTAPSQYTKTHFRQSRYRTSRYRAKQKYCNCRRKSRKY